jgi:hypothetical protein
MGQPSEASSRGCWVECQVDIARIHRDTSTDSPTLREIASGDQLDTNCSPTPGGRYSDCGGGIDWIGVTYQDQTGAINGWVAASCVQYVQQ